MFHILYVIWRSFECWSWIIEWKLFVVFVFLKELKKRWKSLREKNNYCVDLIILSLLLLYLLPFFLRFFFVFIQVFFFSFLSLYFVPFPPFLLFPLQRDLYIKEYPIAFRQFVFLSLSFFRSVCKIYALLMNGQSNDASEKKQKTNAERRLMGNQ